jgi:acyl-CoA thioester hydrolase
MSAAAVASRPIGGTLEGKVHRLPVRVYYEDTDAAGIVYHTSYLRFCERGRTEMMRALGVEVGRIREDLGFVFVLHSAEVKFRRATRLGDELTVETALVGVGAASVNVRQRVLQAATGQEVVRFDALLACTTDSRAARLPGAVRDKIQAFLSEV